MSAPDSGFRETADKRRVLIIDDQLDSAELLALVLANAGCETRVVSDATQAVAAGVEFLPHVALIDIGLPEIDGVELLGALRGKPELAGCQFVAVSGYARQEIEERAGGGAFSAYLRKPVDFGELYRVIGAFAPARAVQ